MPLSKLVFKSGINRDQTNYASEGGWFDMQLARFRSGFPEKFGGWLVQTQNAYEGVARSIFTWNTTDGGQIIGVGTNEKMYAGAATNLYDITPIRETLTSPDTDNCFQTTDTSNVVIVNIIGNGAIDGDWVTFSGVTGTVGGIPDSELNAEFQITYIDSNSFSITVTTPATSTVAAGGGTAIEAAFQINIGYPVTTLGYGWGTGPWSRGAWGSASNVPVNLPARLIFQQNFNNDLIWNIRYSDIYYWVYTAGFNTRSVLLSDISGAVAVPQQVSRILFTPQGFLLALGCTTYDPLASPPQYLGYYDPLMIRWSNVDADIGPQPEVWEPSLTNTAGFLRIQSGSQIITAINTRQETLVFTNLSLHSLQYLGSAEVFGLQELSHNISIMGPNAVAGTNNITYWMGTDRFYAYSGRVDALPCTLRQYIFTDINLVQRDLVFAGVNNQFNEIIWFYCTANSNEINRYVIYNFLENIWYFGQLSRTTWLDSGVFDHPLSTSSGWVYQQENGVNDGQPLGAPPLPIESYIQSADIDINDGDKYMLVRRIIPDVNFNGSETVNPVTGAPIDPQAVITVGVRNFPGATSSITNEEGQITARDVITTATVDQYTNQVFIRARGRQMNFKISSNGVGTQWQLGMPRVDARPDGTRN
jgi:hypothetical protein